MTKPKEKVKPLKLPKFKNKYKTKLWKLKKMINEIAGNS